MHWFLHNHEIWPKLLAKFLHNDEIEWSTKVFPTPSGWWLYSSTKFNQKDSIQYLTKFFLRLSGWWWALAAPALSSSRSTSSMTPRHRIRHTQSLQNWVVKQSTIVCSAMCNCAVSTNSKSFLNLFRWNSFHCVFDNSYSNRIHSQLMMGGKHKYSLR